MPIGRPGIEEEGHAGETRHGLSEQLEPFPGNFGNHELSPVVFPPAAPGSRPTRLAQDRS